MSGYSGFYAYHPASGLHFRVSFEDPGSHAPWAWSFGSEDAGEMGAVLWGNASTAAIAKATALKTAGLAEGDVSWIPMQ